MGRLFGTDGVRGVAGEDLTARLAMDLAVAAVPVLASPALSRPLAVIGRDPRASGDFLEAAVVAGLASSGVDVLRLGVIPTPGVAYLTQSLNADFGVVLSASHNPAQDNGIKFFGRGGVKLPDEVEDEIAARLGAEEPTTMSFGRVTDAQPKQELYLDHLVASLRDPSPLTGLRVVVDCAHGAAYSIAPRALRRAGAEVITIGAAPDGDNINAGSGSTALGALSAAVVDSGADAGIAFDGDADRCLAVDADGNPMDGDQILTALALDMKDAGQLDQDTVVVTVMSNLGFRTAMRQSGISVVETPVGDKHVYAAMRDGGYVLGGEQSGHIIQMRHATTGDGLLTALHLLAAVNRRGVPMSAVATMMTRYPQVLVNVRGDKTRAMAAPALAEAVTSAQLQLSDTGRVLLRPSGTEPAIRVMVEAADEGQAERVAAELADAVRAAMS
jgi:phosphoglucosamine mutase